MDEAYSIEDFRDAARQRLAAMAATAMAVHRPADYEMDALVDAARALCRDELRWKGRFALHGLDESGDGLTPSEEAYLSVGVAGASGEDWLSLTYWLSDLALADRDPERVRAVIAAIARTQEKLQVWLDKEAALAAPPAEAPAAD